MCVVEYRNLKLKASQELEQVVESEKVSLD